MFWEKTLQEEIKTWNCSNLQEREEKREREMIRYPKLIQDLKLSMLSLDDATVVEIGSGPISLLSFIQAKLRVAIDPLINEYAKYYTLRDDIKWIAGKGEEASKYVKDAKLVLLVNSLDHTENPSAIICEIIKILKPSGYLGVISCIDNAITNPHPAHKLNINEQSFHNMVDSVFETCWELTYKKDNYRYGWRKYNNQRGTPAFCWLGRNIGF